jgi:branched-chain amino acid transport system substrate-binding protein
MALTVLMALVPPLSWAAAREGRDARAAPVVPPPVLIGLLTELTGAGASYGRDLLRGAQMAVSEINAQGGLRGRSVALTVADGGTNPASSAVAMRRLVLSGAEVVVGGWGSAQVLANLEVAEEGGMPYVVVGATHPAITQPRNRWTFRVIQTDTAQADALAGVVVDSLKARSVAIFNDVGAYGSGSRDAFVAGLARRGLTPVRIESYPGDAQDFGAALERIREAKPEVLAIFGTVPAAPLIMKQARALGITARFLGTGGLANERLITDAGSAAHGTLLTGLFHQDVDADARAWAARYTAAYQGEDEPPRPQLAAWAYRAVRHIVGPCLNQVSSGNRPAMRDCLSRWHGRIAGIPGEVRFDAVRQLVQPVLMLEITARGFLLWKAPAR